MNDHYIPEPHAKTISQRLNWLRAGVLGANDGIVSIAAVVVGIAGATNDQGILMLSGIAALVAGAISMALGEYVSVSTQRDSEHALITKETRELLEMPEAELEELTQIYQGKGLTRTTAEQVAKELTAHDALAAHLSAELGIDQHDIVSPWQAAGASAMAFTIGGALPLLAITTHESIRIWFTFVVVVATLALTGYLAAWLGESPKRASVIRLIAGGTVALIVTYLIGSLLGISGVV